MTVPEGTFLAPVRSGVIQLPPAIRQYCESEGWTLFRFVVIDHDHVTMQPVMPGDTREFHASLTPDGTLWLPAEMRQSVSLSEQSVMLRVEGGAINMYIRKVFETLGFGPGL
ncbi:MAG TPA: hypothetical protein VG273_14025 [Bryobacteraceae bacterium]|jgi:hypothetical protein|nr:hypothetical protein [Bryobacteraceae bacterium]